MINLTYKASSGRVYNLQSEILTKAANFHTWEFSAIGNNLQYGQQVTGFTKDPAVYSADLVFNGSTFSRRQSIASLHEDFEIDIRTSRPGRLTWGQWYIDCFAVASTTTPSDRANYTVNAVDFYCPRPFWVREVKKSIFPQTVGGDQSFLDYQFDYRYDYYYGSPGIAVWQTDISLSSDFALVVFGPAADPRILINGHPYEFYDTLEGNEYVTIDSRSNTIYKSLANGQKANLFDQRNKAESIFERIPGGTLTFNWSGSFGFDLTLYDERSEPTWSI